MPRRPPDLLIIAYACVDVVYGRERDRRGMNELVCVWQRFYKSCLCVFCVRKSKAHLNRPSECFPGNSNENYLMRLLHFYFYLLPLWSIIYPCGSALISVWILQSYNVQSRAKPHERKCQAKYGEWIQGTHGGRLFKLGYDNVPKIIKLTCISMQT